MAGCVETNFRNHFTVTGAHLTKMTLERTRAHSQVICCVPKGYAALPQRRGNGRSHRVSGGQTDGLHGRVMKGREPSHLG